MIYITQVIYVKEGREADFHAFEAEAIPLLKKHGGRLHQRIRPGKENYIEGEDELPYEIHLVSFPSEDRFKDFMQDDARQLLVPLKEASVRSMLLIRGELL